MVRRGRSRGAPDGMTLVEILVAMVVSSMVVLIIVASFRIATIGTTAVQDRGDQLATSGWTMNVVRSLLKKAIEPVGTIPERFRIQPFRSLPSGWVNGGLSGGVHFFADVNDDGQYEWVWLWVDPYGADDFPGDVHPRPPYLKVTAFQQYPTDPRVWADYVHQFFTGYINNDRRTHHILASNLSLDRWENIGGNLIGIRQGFGVDLRDDRTRATLQFGFWLDRDLDGGVSARELPLFLAEEVHLDGTLVNVNTAQLNNFSNNLTVVRDSSFFFPIVNWPASRLKGLALLRE